MNQNQIEIYRHDESLHTIQKFGTQSGRCVVSCQLLEKMR